MAAIDINGKDIFNPHLVELCEEKMELILLIIAVLAGYQVYLYIYFNGEEFKEIKDSIQEYTNDCNELNDHLEVLKSSQADIRSYDYGSRNLHDESNYKFQRKEWGKSIRHHKVHHCSAAVCKNASDQPFKYLCKYFDIKTDEESLSGVESLLNDFSAAEQGKMLLKKQKTEILTRIKGSIPAVIFRFSEEKLVEKLGFEPVDLSDLYFPVYTFQYVSAGGNSSIRCDIRLDVDNLDRFVRYLSDIVKFRKSVAGQRALMTSGLREKIKTRDNFACKICNLSTRDEENLLLEIDHIVPLSKGGITSEENLQTLCWRCNRSKGAKLMQAVDASGSQMGIN